MRSRRNRMPVFMTWDQAYRLACIEEAAAALRGLGLLAAALVVLVLLFPTPWVRWPATVVGGVLVVRAARWLVFRGRAELGLIRPPADDSEVRR